MELEKLLTNLLDRLDRIDEGGKGKFADKKANYKDYQTNQKLHNGQLIDVEVTKIESNYCEVYSAKDNVFAYVPCKEPAYMP